MLEEMEYLPRQGKAFESAPYRNSINVHNSFGCWEQYIVMYSERLN